MTVEALTSTIGIPRGLLFFEYYPLWKTFFQTLGMGVVTSPPTSAQTMDRGVRLAVDEACVPVKAFFGHAVELADRVDMLFVPRIVSVEPRAYTCPKLLGLPDMVAALGDTPPILTVDVDATRRRSPVLVAAVEICRTLGFPVSRAVAAYSRAIRAYRRFCRSLVESGGWFDEADDRGGSARGSHQGGASVGAPRILVVGHSYVLNDDALTLGLRSQLERLGVLPMAPDSVPQAIASRCAARLPKQMFWTYQKKIYGSAVFHMERRSCDGVIQVMSFGCGPDSLISELIRREALRRRVPYMALTVDEHTGEAGVRTRIEAFVDMLKRKRCHLV